jgi:thiol-disulfide isomerase/thioredoxin
MRFKALPEGLLVEAVQGGMGAADAGLLPGDLVIAVGELSAVSRPSGDVRAAIIGPADTTVEMTVRAPLTRAERTVTVERRQPPEGRAQPRTRNRPPPAIQRLNSALRRGSPDEAAQQAQELLTAELDGMSMGEAVRSGLRLAAKEQPDNARAAMAVLDEHGADDWLYQRARGEALQLIGENSDASQAFRQAESLRPPDHLSQDGQRSDLGGDPAARRMWIESAWAAQQRSLATRQARRLFRSGYKNTDLLGLIGMAPLNDGTPWSAALPALTDFSVELLDGDRWTLTEQSGDVVVIAFWATWCGPCRKEMPELQGLWDERREDGVSFLAISTDDPEDLAKVHEKVEEFGITFPVTRQPELRDGFNVTGIPAIRVLNRRGALHYATKGYSPTSVARLDEQIGAALEQTSDETLLGAAWSQDSRAQLLHFLPLAGSEGIWSQGGQTVVGVSGAAPLTFSGPLPDRAEATLDANSPASTGQLAWLDGPIGAEPRSRVIRAWDESGDTRWVQTTPAPITDMVVSGSHIWVATRGGVHAFSADGTLSESHELALSDLASGDEGVWGIGDDRLWQLAADAAPRDAGPAPSGIRVDSLGGFSTGIATDLVVGRFGPGGAPRPVAVRTDNTIIATAGDGAPAFTWALSQPSRITAGDLDGDNQDELLVSISGQGVAVVELNLP